MRAPDHWFDLVAGHISRRDFVRIGRDISAVIALGALPGSAGASLRRTVVAPFPFGVASGDPLPDGVVLWTRLDSSLASAAGASPIAVRWEIAEDDSFTRVRRSGDAVAPTELGHSVHVEVDGLLPGRPYWYRFDVAGEVSAVGRTRTAPAVGTTPEALRFAFASCANYEHGYFTAYRHLAEDEPDLVIHLGDYIYERRFGNDHVREHEAAEVFSLEQYRARYATYKLDPDLQTAHAAAPWVVTWDDHEVENNYADRDSEQNDSRDLFSLRRAAAYQAYYEAMPLRRAAMPSGPDLQLYRRLAFGNLLDLHVVDTRQYRSNQACDDGNKPMCAEALESGRTLLGDAQERWLEQGIRSSSARWKVLANQVLLAGVVGGTAEAPTYSMDVWSGYPEARARMVDILAAAPGSAIVLTGDIHSNWAAEIKRDYESESSPVVALELVGTSIASGGDGNDNTPGSVSRNPHIKFFSARRGYVRAEVRAERVTADFREVPFVTVPGAPVETRTSFVIEHGRPELLRV